jgi:hypothetical protein
MMLVTAGLLLIVTRIALGRSNEWLIRMNLITLTATLYVCSLVNLAAVIADYNVSHSREMTGKGVNIDMGYLLSLGPHALPAIDRIAQPDDPLLAGRRDGLLEGFRRQTSSWRAWGLRNARLQHYLDRQPGGPATR